MYPQPYDKTNLPKYMSSTCGCQTGRKAQRIEITASTKVPIKVAACNMNIPTGASMCTLYFQRDWVAAGWLVTNQTLGDMLQRTFNYTYLHQHLNFYQVLMNNLLPTVAAGWLWLHNPTGKLCNGCDIARNIQYTKCRSWKYCTQSFTPRTVCAIREKDITFKKSCYHGHLLHANQFSWSCSQTLMPKQSLCMAMSIMCGLKCVCI